MLRKKIFEHMIKTKFYRPKNALCPQNLKPGCGPATSFYEKKNAKT